ncbi:unnamed protein product [Ectocarpus sp. CCAP 1310/34]|nr:unnamed protein product [Ectocarpus sp. CCAP 1310/34]
MLRPLEDACSMFQQLSHATHDPPPQKKDIRSSSARHTRVQVVISTTETLQRSLSMVNNRVFEALSCGAAVVHLLGNDTARTDLGRRGRELVLSKHTFASRVVTILSSMDEVVALKNQEETSAAGEASSAAARRLALLPGETTAAATARGDLPARGAAGADAIAAAVNATAMPTGGGGVESCCQSGRACRNAVEFTACPTPTTAPGEGGENLTTTVPSCPAEGTPPGEDAATEELRQLSRPHHDPFPPSPSLRAATPVRAHQRPDHAQPLVHGAGEHATGSGDISRDDATQGTPCNGSGDHSTKRRFCYGSKDDTTSGACHYGSSDTSTTGTPCNGGSGDGTKRATSRNDSGNPDYPLPQLLGRKKTPLVVRPNAPLVLVVYRSESPPPGQLRRDLQSAAGAVAGGARIAFMETTAETLGVSDSGVECFGWGRRIGAEELSRLQDLQTRVSRLLADAGRAAAHGEHGNTLDVDFLGVEAAREAHGFMEWCCSVGDPLERWFLHRLVGEHASRVVRTAFLAVAAGGPESAEQQHGFGRQEHEIARRRHGMAGQHGKALTFLEAQRLDCYEWVEHLGGCGEGRSCPRSVLSEGGYFAEETGGKTCPSASRLKNKVEQTLFGVRKRFHDAVG